ncbi:hypothetical protein [Alysiella crassa]|nr:hypothetical protein [Alysiella crassa]
MVILTAFQAVFWYTAIFNFAHNLVPRPDLPAWERIGFRQPE